MYTQHVQKSPQLGRGQRRMWVFLSLLALALVAGLALSLAPRLGHDPAPVEVVPPVAADPAAPSVLSYIQAHERLVARPAAPDAATAGTQGYIQAHERLVARPAPDAATAGTQGYIQAHERLVVRPAPDAATQGVLNYLRAHGAPIR